MTKHDRAVSFACLIIVVIAAVLCSCAQLAGGDVTETGNARISGSVIDTLGFGIQNVRIQLLPALYDPVRDGTPSDSFAAITDESGSFILRTPSGGIYNVEMVDPANGDRALISNVRVFGHDTISVPIATIKRPGAIKARLSSPVAVSYAYVYLPGTTRFGHVVDSVAIIDSVPAGSYSALCYINRTDTLQNRTIKTNFTVAPGSIAFFTADQAWGFSKKLYLNTASSGAAVSGAVYLFPVLVRLSAAQFVFSQAKIDGGDVRFVKEDGSPLPFEIERWDPVAQQAELWVKVDTVFGNDSTHYFTMIWGDSLSTRTSNGAAVFDTAAGFTGVWHLGENNDSVHDATADVFNGMNAGTTPTTGMIGNARKFTSGNYIKIAGLLKTPASVTLSAWVSSDTLNWGQNNNWGQEIISIGDYAGVRLDDAFGIGTSGWFQNKPIGPGPDSSFVMVNSGQFLANTGWHFIAFSINSSTHVQTLYIDGVQCATTNDANPIYYSGLGSDTYIGIHGNGEKIYNFSGQIDEVRVNKTALSPDWIKLCFMNQKEQDALVKW